MEQTFGYSFRLHDGFSFFTGDFTIIIPCIIVMTVSWHLWL